jgi:hypothetical protein
MSQLIKTRRIEALTSYIPDGQNWKRCDRLWCFGITVTEMSNRVSLTVDWASHTPELPTNLRLGIPAEENGYPLYFCEIPEEIRIEVVGNVDGGLTLDGRLIALDP